jgi:RNA polymerase sigma factor (sigma-70 family)
MTKDASHHDGTGVAAARQVSRMAGARDISRAPCTSPREIIGEAYATYGLMVMSICRRITGAHDLAEDASQITWLRAFNQLPSLKDRDKLCQWLKAIARHTALDIVDRMRHDPSTEVVDLSSLADPEPDAEATVIKAEILTEEARLVEAVDHAIDAVIQPWLRPIVRAWLRGAKPRELAVEYQVLVTTLGPELTKAKKAIRLSVGVHQGAARNSSLTA